MIKDLTDEQGYSPQLRLLLEELCCEICRFAYRDQPGVTPDGVRVEREYFLGKPKTYADVLVAPQSSETFIIEVKFGYSSETLQKHLRRKYADITPSLADVKRIVLVVDTIGRSDWPQLQNALRECVHPNLTLDFWNE